MKRHAILSFLAVAIAAVCFAREPRGAVLIVQNHVPDPDVTIAFLALTDELTAMLSGPDLQVINPYNLVGVNQNRDARGEKMPEVSAMELAQRFKAEGMITASVVEFRETPPSGAERKFALKMVLNLADAQTGKVVCGAEGADTTEKYMATQIQSHRATYINNLMSKVLDKCTKKLLADPLLKNWKPTQPPPKPLPPRPEPKRPVFDKIVDKLSVEMLSSSQFVKNYEEQKGKGERLPIAVIGGMENESGHPEFDAGLKASGERFRKKLFDSKLFDVKDDAILVNLAKRIVASGNSATENGDLMEELKQHGSPDFFVIGNLNHFADLDGTGYYKFRVTMHSLRTGKIVWEGIETITSNGGTGK